MSNATPSRFGLINNAGTADAMFLKVFSGEVMSTFEKESVFLDKHMVRTIASGKSAQFPIIGENTAAYHTPGNEILGSVVKNAEQVITIDDLLISHVFIASIDEAKSHYDVRAPYSGKVAYALRDTFDTNLAQVTVLAARAAHPIDAISLDTRTITNVNAATDGDVLAERIFKSQEVMDTNKAPQNDRYTAVKPAQYYLLVQTTKVINRDWGGSGVYADGTVLKVAGSSIVKSLNIPSTNVVAGPAAYQGDFTKTVAVSWQKEAVGTVKLLDMASEMEYDIRRQGTLIVCKYAMGHGVLRPECAVEIATP